MCPQLPFVAIEKFGGLHSFARGYVVQIAFNHDVTGFL